MSDTEKFDGDEGTLSGGLDSGGLRVGDVALDLDDVARPESLKP